MKTRSEPAPLAVLLEKGEVGNRKRRANEIQSTAVLLLSHPLYRVMVRKGVGGDHWRSR